MADKQMSEQESWLIIQQMIDTAKTEQKDDGKGWILWGWVLFAASILTYLNIVFDWFNTFFFWNLFGVFTIVFFLFILVRTIFFKPSERVKTYTADLFHKLNIGFFLTLFLIIFSINLGVSPAKGFSLLIGLYAFWVLIYGAALDFKPSVIGAYLMWVIAFISMFLDGFQWVMLLHGLAVLIGYIIPGHIANREFRKIKKA